MYNPPTTMWLHGMYVLWSNWTRHFLLHSLQPLHARERLVVIIVFYLLQGPETVDDHVSASRQFRSSRVVSTKAYAVPAKHITQCNVTRYDEILTVQTNQYQVMHCNTTPCNKNNAVPYIKTWYKIISIATYIEIKIHRSLWVVFTFKTIFLRASQ